LLRELTFSMSKIFITGSSDGIGELAAKSLVEQGHEVTMHARNAERGAEALDKVPGAKAVLTADLSRIEETKELASKVNELGTFDAVIHNAGVYRSAPEQIFSVNTLAPYILTCLINRPQRLIYISSSIHMQGRTKMELLEQEPPRVNYGDSKLHAVLLAKAIARHWPDVYANALDPGWVPTKMGGPSAPDSLQKGYETQVWLAVSDDPAAKVSGRYFHHQKEVPCKPEADDVELQDRFVSICEKITSIQFP
jgi:NAD(P)-dependent dehydrogenase (short-subunit alcohol dehydrogenase family)